MISGSWGPVLMPRRHVTPAEMTSWRAGALQLELSMGQQLTTAGIQVSYPAPHVHARRMGLGAKTFGAQASSIKPCSPLVLEVYVRVGE